ncbi:MAG: carboxypeptidase regulatory-like domain-containing protein [Calditrichaceae bacterium]|nr:carboxypeptidase regulatory-like domain-containing protein [Calditrichaceae bacterium]
MNFLQSTIILMFTAHFLFAANGSIMGMIGDEKTKEPIAGAEISVQETEMKTTTDQKGKYIIPNLKPGYYSIQVKCIGYKTTIIEDIKVKKNATTTVDIWMVSAGIGKETITIKKRSKEEIDAKKPFRYRKEKPFSDIQDDKIFDEAKKNSSTKKNDKSKPTISSAVSRVHDNSDKKNETKESTFNPYDRPDTDQYYGENKKTGNDETVSNEILFYSPPVNEGKKPEPKIEISEPVQNKLPGFSGLKAGFVDDNEQFNYFLNFLQEYGQDLEYYPIKIEERIHLKILDRSHKSIPNANIKIRVNNKVCHKGKTYADGSFFIYPLQAELNAKSIDAEVEYQNQTKIIKIDRNGPRQVDIVLDVKRESYQSIPIDLLFILDVTGSMGEELERLKTSIEIINLNIASLNIRPDIRFGLVSYRDQDDDFITKLIPFTSDLQAFQREINKLDAKGGGDDPEDLQSALKDAMQKMNWNDQGIRLAFIITDAAIHLDYGQKYTYVRAAEEAKAKGIKIFSVGTGGLDIAGEYILRQISQYTYGKYIFLTYGEEGESEGGRPGSVSHHTGSNFQTDKLEAIIIHFAKEELSHLSEIEVIEDERFIQAMKVDFEEKEETVEKLFTAAVDELWDYSSMALPDPVNLNVIPLSVSLESLENTAEYFTERLNFALSRMAGINLIERKDLQFIADELKIQLSGVVEVSDAAKIGQWIGADYQIIGNLYFKDGNYETYLKLVRVSTAEILSVTKLKIDHQLGL